MTKIQDGYQNEFLIVLEFNNKKVKELNPMLREVVDDLFPEAGEESIIKSWRNHINNQKGDILIKVDGQIRKISIKKGNRNSVHLEHIEAFKNFLRELGVKEKIIYEYELYHYGVDKFNCRKILSSKEFCAKNKRKIQKINYYLSKVNVDKIVDRFILCGNMSSYRIDGIIYGTPNDFFWINKDDILKIIKKTINNYSSTVHIGCLYIQPMNRCINNNKKYMWCRDYVQIKWYSLFDNIIEYKNEKYMKQNKYCDYAKNLLK